MVVEESGEAIAAYIVGRVDHFQFWFIRALLRFMWINKGGNYVILF